MCHARLCHLDTIIFLTECGLLNNFYTKKIVYRKKNLLKICLKFVFKLINKNTLNVHCMFIAWIIYYDLSLSTYYLFIIYLLKRSNDYSPEQKQTSPQISPIIFGNWLIEGYLTHGEISSEPC